VCGRREHQVRIFSDLNADRTRAKSPNLRLDYPNTGGLSPVSRIRIQIVLGVAVACLFGASAATASAAHFKAAAYPAEVEAKQINDQGFQVTGAVSVCKKAKFVGTLAAESTTLTVHPTYTECTVELAGTHAAKVDTTGCNLDFTAAAPETAAGTVAIVCETGKEIEIEVEGITGCVIKLPGQVGLKTIEDKNESGSVHVNADVSGLTWSSTAACSLAETSGTNGLYREGKLNASEEPELGEGFAEVLTSAFKPATTEKIAIEVTST
jgi:hypothetical protein